MDKVAFSIFLMDPYVLPAVVWQGAVPCSPVKPRHSFSIDALEFFRVTRNHCHAPNMFGTVDIGITSPAFQKLKSFFKNIFIGLKHLELKKRKIADVIPCTGYYEFKKDSDANDMTVQQYYRKTYNIHIK